MGIYFDSYGNAHTQAQVDRKIRKAKQQKIEIFIDNHNRQPFCQECFRNDCVPVDMSHDISVQDCKNKRMVEKAWDVTNITPRGRKCHQKKDGLTLKFKKNAINN